MKKKPWLSAKTAGEAFLTCTKRYGQSWAEDGAAAVGGGYIRLDGGGKRAGKKCE